MVEYRHSGVKTWWNIDKVEHRADPVSTWSKTLLYNWTLTLSSSAVLRSILLYWDQFAAVSAHEKALEKSFFFFFFKLDPSVNWVNCSLITTPVNMIAFSLTYTKDPTFSKYSVFSYTVIYLHSDLFCPEKKTRIWVHTCYLNNSVRIVPSVLQLWHEMNFILRFVLLILSKKKRIFQLDQLVSVTL